jgi:adenylate cyclase, class 2
LSVLPAGKSRETEVKIRVEKARLLQARLKRLGFIRLHAKALEDNILFDTPARDLRKTRSLVRVRSYGSRWTVTYKGTPDPDRYFKSRLELESEIDDPKALQAIFLKLGLVPVFRYQKYRTQFALPHKDNKVGALVEVALDETPIGDFIELEGSRRAIDRTARELGYSREDYNTASYGALYLEDCQQKGIAASDMVFATLRSPAQRVKRTLRDSAIGTE